jgi:hypothetical protein
MPLIIININDDWMFLIFMRNFKIYLYLGVASLINNIIISFIYLY